MADDAPGPLGLLLDRLRRLAASGEQTMGWLRTWMPAALAAQRLAFTLFALARHLREASRDEALDPLPEALREEIADDLEGLREAFPDAPTLLFGIDHIDTLVERVFDDDLAREHALALGRRLADAADGLIGRFLDMLMEPEGFEVAPERLTDFLERVESLLQRLLDRWIWKD